MNLLETTLQSQETSFVPKSRDARFAYGKDYKCM